MPDEFSVNNFMSSICEDFKYNSVNDVARDLNKGDYNCVFDITSAVQVSSNFFRLFKVSGHQMWRSSEKTVCVSA